MCLKRTLILALLLCVSCKKSAPSADLYSTQETSVASDELAGGGNYESKKMESTELSSPQNQVQSAPTVQGKEIIQSPMLIKTGQLSFQVKSFVAAKKEISAVIPRYNAYISSENENHQYGEKQCVMQIRVPAIHFDSLVESISKSATDFDGRTISVQDVGEEFADISARMKAKKEVELRYIAILSRANKISEILEIEQKIGEVRAEIESMQGRLNYLSSQVSFSTLTITFYERHSVPMVQRENFFGRIFSSFISGWHGLLNLLVSLTVIWPFLLFGIAVLVLIQRAKRRKKTQKGSTPKP